MLGYVVDPYRDRHCPVCSRRVPFALWLRIFSIHKRGHRKIGPQKRVGLGSEADD